MQKHDYVKFAEIMTGISEVFEMQLSEMVLEIWFEAFDKFTVEEFSDAVGRYIQNPDSGKFKPKPADIIKILVGSSSDRSMLAWTKLDKAVRTIGDYQTVVFDDPIIHRVITDMGGWIGFGDVPEKEWPFKGKEFMQRYGAYVSRGDVPEHAVKLLGVHDDGNKNEGFESQEPVLIGDHDKAQLVLDNKAQPIGMIGNKIEGKR